jgi:hypothetical protein
LHVEQLLHTLSAVAVHPDTSYCPAPHTVQLAQQLASPLNPRLPFMSADGLYCSPPWHVGHAPHFVSDVVVQFSATYSPAAHDEQSPSTASADAVHAETTYWPAPAPEQLLHTRFCCPTQSYTSYWSAPHAASQGMQQSDKEAELAFEAALYCPAPHAGQKTHFVSDTLLHPESTYCPPLHTVQFWHTASCRPPHSVAA